MISWIRSSKKKSFIWLFALLICPLAEAQNLLWESPEILITGQARFPRVVQGGGKIVLVYEEVTPGPGTGGDIWLSMWITNDTKNWIKKPRFAGPFKYVDKETQIFSLAVDSKGEIYVAAAKEERKVTIYYSKDNASTFTFTDIIAAETTVSPQLFMRNDDRFYLFVTYQTPDSLSIHYVLLTDSIFARSEMELVLLPFVSESGFGFNFLPYYSRHNDADFVVFQSRLSGETGGYQLYVKKSNDEGVTWSPPSNITSITETVRGAGALPGDFSNQRPYLASIGGKLYVAWERQYIGLTPQIYLSTIDANGNMLSYQRVTNSTYSCYFPQILTHLGSLYVLWFDNQRGDDHIKIARKEGELLREEDLTISLPGVSQFAQPVRMGNSLYLFWENRLGGSSRLIMLEPDQTVDAPSISARNFISGRPQAFSRAVVTWNVPFDSSGISGFRYIWYKQGARSEALSRNVFKDVTQAALDAESDGQWVFELQAEDYANNLSRPAIVYFIRDTTPPSKVDFLPFAMDKDGFLDSNTFHVAWKSPPDSDVAGYAYAIQLVSQELESDVSSFDEKRIAQPGRNIQIFERSRSFANQDNGVWGFSVRAIDRVGNSGESRAVFFKLNKYVPYTYINYISKDVSEEGTTTIKITGRGFTSNGIIKEVFLDNDGKEPYDYRYYLSGGDFRVTGDREIDRLRLKEVEEGDYRVGLIHERRGLYLSQITVSVEPERFVIRADFTPFVPSFEKTGRPLFTFHINDSIIILLLLLLGLALIVSFRKLAAVVREGQFIEAEVTAIMSGGEPKAKIEKQIRRLRTKGIGLRIKFAALTTAQVILIILMLSITLSYYMLQTQEGILADGLRERAKVLLGSVSSGAEKSLPIQNTTELGILLDQRNAMEEAIFITITGMTRIGSQQPGDKEYVWASNDQDILEKIDTPEYTPGVSILSGEGVSDLVSALLSDINSKATSEVSSLAEEVKSLTREATSLIGRTDERSRQRFAELSAAVDVKGRTLAQRLAGISSVIGSYPEFDIRSLKKTYTFYKPIVYRLDVDELYFRGVVRLEVSTDKILATIGQSQRDIITMIVVVSLIAIALGILGAVLLASITIRPIKKLALGVEKIRDTEDKSMLKDHVIDIKQKDEIRLLADAINQMTQGLVKASNASKDLTLGKEIQKMFIPLEKNEAGKKGTTGHEENENIEIFGYYEGAKGVSGDYFDYVPLGTNHFAVIKCDVSGKGVPAALIMVEVATIFIDYFRNWTPANPGLRTDLLVAKINDLVEGRGFKGRFAALIVGIIDVKSGTCYFCNAGDNILHVYAEKKGKVITRNLPVIPAAGVFHSSLIEMQTGFKQATEKLDSGDILFLMSDGFDEAKREFRDSKGNQFVCEEPSLKDGEDHGKTHKRGEDGEVLGLDRVYEIIEAIRHKGGFVLQKSHHWSNVDQWSFDFSRVDGSVRDTVMGLVAVEKVFRVYKPENATLEDKVIVDKKVADYWSKHFVQYGYYFSNKIELPDNPDYVAFTHLREDEQYDDLTMLAIKKK